MVPSDKFCRAAHDPPVGPVCSHSIMLVGQWKGLLQTYQMRLIYGKGELVMRIE